MKSLRIAAAQTPDFHDDIEAALRYAASTMERAEADGAALLCFPESYLQGYLTDEASARRAALDLKSPEFQSLIDRLPSSDMMIVLGLIEWDAGRLFNSACVIQSGAVIGCYRKSHLLDGERIFDPGSECPIFETNGVRFGINICNDMNFPGQAQKVADGGGRLIVAPANNMLRQKTAELYRQYHNAERGRRCRETGMWLLSADVTGRRGDRISWGPTALLDSSGDVVAQLPLDEPSLLVVDFQPI
jgi:predicted amidohydrolase